jgi:hypothetical protein
VTAMNLDIVASAGGIIGGALAGGLMGRRSARREPPTPVSAPEEDALTDAWVERTADEWAVAHGRPEARSVIANKLRLGIALSRRRWSR